MIKLRLLLLFILGNFIAFSQEECFQRLELKTLAVNRLEKQLDSTIKSISKSKKLIVDNFQKNISSLENQKNEISKAFQDTVAEMRNLRSSLNKKDVELANYEDFKKNRKEYLKEKDLLTREVEELKNQKQQKINEIDELKKGKAENSKVKFKEGEESIINKLVDKYNKKSFDELISENNENSIVRDMNFLKQYELLSPVLSDLKTFFEIKKVLSFKYGEADNLNALEKIGVLKNKYTQSTSISELLKTIEKYKDVNNSFKVCLLEISKLDEIEQVAGMSREIRMNKFRKISGSFSSFYIEVIKEGIKIDDYTYLNKIMHEILKKKISDVDAEVGSLIEKN